MGILTIRDVQGISGRDFTAQRAIRARKPGPKSYRPDVVVKARVNWGRWIGDCPFCPGAELVDAEDPRFFCLSCFNEAAGGDWLAVEMPKRRETIEAVLMRRPNATTRNWHPHESVADLVRENQERGL